MDIAAVNRQLISARPYYQAVNPGISNVFAIPIHRKTVKFVLAAWKHRDIPRRRREGESVASITGDFIGARVIKKMTSPVKSRMAKVYIHANRAQHDWTRHNGIGGRSWITKPGRYKMVIIYHDANRAGPHIDVHIDRLSLIYRVKPELYPQLRYNREGRLTEASQKLLLDHVRSEVEQGAFVPQNIDHTKRNARAEWVFGDREATEYGSGYTRQVLLETEVDIYKAHHNGPIEMYAPAIYPHRPVYLHRVFPASDKRAPILVWGHKSADPPKLKDRLHLTMIDPKEMDKLAEKADMSTSTAKYDGASCYFVITKDGTTVWSPRTLVKTGKQIDYTHKVNGIANLTNPETVVGMGELLFRTKDGSYIPAASVGGTLNSHALPSKDLIPEIRIYRIDRVGRTNTTNVDFWENRKIQTKVAKLHPNLKVVDLMDPETAKQKGFEGVVAVPEGASVNDGYKMKWWTDPHDWRIDSIEFTRGEKGGAAGVVHLTSLTPVPEGQQPKTFNLGPGQFGDHDLHNSMMTNPEDYIGTVVKVQSRHGHEGRAAKVVAIHQDKGFAPI